MSCSLLFRTGGVYSGSTSTADDVVSRNTRMRSHVQEASNVTPILTRYPGVCIL